MTDQPTFSIITIFLDAARFLPEAADSVFAQELDDWEWLLVDDGSTDSSRDLARELSERDHRVRYLEHPGHQNRGMGASRNLGLTEARGRYLACLDSDDGWFPTTLSGQAATLDAHPEAAMSYGNALWFWEAGEKADWSDGVAAKVPEPDSLVEPPTLARVFLRDGGAVPCWCAVAFRTAAVREVGGFDQSLRDELRDLYEDQVIYSKLFLEKPVFVRDEVLGRYRQHADQICSRIDDETQATARELFLHWLSDYIDERGIDDAEVRAALSEAIGAVH
jgi:glycosyltransferase involved in cell wall biosynthesis